jgi:hypothetical protein
MTGFDGIALLVACDDPQSPLQLGDFALGRVRNLISVVALACLAIGRSIVGSSDPIPGGEGNQHTQ